MVTTFVHGSINEAGAWCPLRGFTTEYAEARIPSDPSNAYYAEFYKGLGIDPDEQRRWWVLAMLYVHDQYANDVDADWRPWESWQEREQRRLIESGHGPIGLF